MTWESYLRPIWDERKAKGLVGSLLTLLSKGYEGALRLRHLGYDRLPFLSKAVGVPVVSVGSIAVGGAGKTPFVHALVQKLGGGVAILSRGYRSVGEESAVEVQESASFTKVGDEALWLKRALPGTLVFIGRDRRKTAALAVEQGAKLLVLDDGMQHRRLRRDMEIVLVDSRDALRDERLLPRGRLRDLPGRLHEADFLVLTHVRDPFHFAKVGKELKRYTEAPLIGTRYVLKEPQAFRGKRIGLFCALGRPKRFIELMQAAGSEVIAWTAEDDHKPFSKEKLMSFAVACAARGVELLVCTEKDAMKLQQGLDLPLPYAVAEIEVEITQGKEHFNAMIEETRRWMKSK